MDKKEQILNTAFILFSEKGYNFSMSDLAKSVKLKTPSLYSHFESKDQIVELIIKKEIENFYSVLNNALNNLQQKHCNEKLKNIFFLIIEYFSCSPKLMFWKHMPLLYNENLKCRIKNEINKNNKFYTDYFTQCFSQEIKEEKVKQIDYVGSVYLYHAMI